jgi:hypothetical protein
MIKYYLPQGIHQASIRIFDVNGRHIKDIPLTEKGYGSVRIAITDLPAGAYTYQLLTDNRYVDAKKMILFR